MSEPEGDATAALSATLLSLITGYMPARVVHTAAQLGICDLLAPGQNGGRFGTGQQYK